MCNTCGQNNGTGTGGNSAFEENFNLFQGGMFNAIEFPEAVSPATDISQDAESNANMLLESGQYKVKLRAEISNDEERQPFTLKNFVIEVPVENEFKRVKIYKMDSIPVSDTERQVTIKFALIDNPVWLAPVLWTLPAIGGWFVVDKVERFAEESPINLGLITITAMGALAFLFLK